MKRFSKSATSGPRILPGAPGAVPPKEANLNRSEAVPAGADPPATVPAPDPLDAVRAENAELKLRLAAAEESLQAIRRGEALTQIRDAVVATDQDRRITFVNTAAERQYGISAAEVLGRPLDTAYRQSWFRPEEEARAAAALREAGYWHGELRHTTRQDKALHIEASFVVLRDPAGQPLGLLAVLRDVTGERELEAALQASEAFIRGVLNSLPDHVAVLDGFGEVRAVNEPWERFARENGASICSVGPGANYLEVCRQAAAAGNAYAREALEGLEAVLAGRRDECTLEYPCDGPGGSRWFLMHAGRARQGPPGVIVSHMNITARKGAELALAEAKRQMEQANELLEQKVAERTARLEETVSELESFSYSISHDMRAPLRAIKSFSGFLRDECQDILPPSARDYLRRIIAAAERMDQLIHDVLVYSRLARVDLPLERIELGSFVRGLLESYPQLSTADARIEIAAPLAAVLANQAALTQCLANLLGNAIKFTAPGVAPLIRVWTETAGTRVRLFIKDNGIGIPARAHERIFEIFQQLDPRHGGTGVGLAVVRKAAERMGGRVTLESTPGAGSTFCLELDAPGHG